MAPTAVVEMVLVRVVEMVPVRVVEMVPVTVVEIVPVLASPEIAIAKIRTPEQMMG